MLTLSLSQIIVQGCTKKLTEFMEQHLIYLIAAGMGVFFMGRLKFVPSMHRASQTFVYQYFTIQRVKNESPV